MDRDSYFSLLTRAKPRLHAEADLQAAIWQHYLLRGNPKAILFSVPNGMPSSKRTGAMFKAQGRLAGVFDMEGIMPDGRPCFVELKTLKGRLTPEQKAFGERLTALGVEWMVAYSLDAALAFLTACGIILPEP